MASNQRNSARSSRLEQASSGTIISMEASHMYRRDNGVVVCCDIAKYRVSENGRYQQARHRDAKYQASTCAYQYHHMARGQYRDIK